MVEGKSSPMWMTASPLNTENISGPSPTAPSSDCPCRRNRREQESGACVQVRFQCSRHQDLRSSAYYTWLLNLETVPSLMENVLNQKSHGLETSSISGGQRKRKNLQGSLRHVQRWKEEKSERQNFEVGEGK